MKTRSLFITTAIVEFTFGLVLVLFPSIATELLLGLKQSTAPGMIVSRLAGAALISLSVACFMARGDGRSIAGRGIITAMLVYNIIGLALLLYVGFSLHFSLLLVSAILIHIVLMIWCGLSLQKSQTK